MAAATLNEKGWHLTEEGFKLCADEAGNKTDKIIEIAKSTDLKEIGEKWLPDDVNKGSCEYVEGKGVLQIQKIRNIAAPKENEESHSAPRLLKVTLTDGHLTCNGVETENLEKFGLNVPPGTKVMLKGTVAVEHGILLLSNKNCQLIGGRVEKMAESWELKKMLSKQSKLRGTAEGGPPPFVPFGHRIQDSRGGASRDNFKALAPKKEEKKEEGDFEKQRQATIAEVMQAMDEKPKTFGGGQKQVGTDLDIAKIMEMGFSAEQASSALKIKNGNFQLAVNYLLQGRGGGRENKFNNRDSRQVPSTGRDQQGRQQREDRRENRGRRQRDEESEEVGSKPSAPATLFDFLSQSKKIPVDSNKENKDSKTSNVPSMSMQYSYDSNKSEKPRYQDSRKSDSRPKSSPATNSEKYSSYDSKPQRQNSAVDRTKNDKYDRGNNDKYDRRNNDKYDRGNNDKYDRGNQQQNNNRNNPRQNRNDGNSARQDNSNNRQDRSSQKPDRQDSRGRQSNNSETNSQDSRWSNNNDKRQWDGRNQNYNDREGRYDRSQNQYQNDRGPQNDQGRNGQNHGRDRGNQNDRGQNPGRDRGNQNDRGQNQGHDRGQNQGRDDRNSNRNPGVNNSSRAEQRNDNYYERSQDRGKYQNNQGTSNQYDSRKSANSNPQYQTASQGKVWNQGEHCLAKYWEDNQFYHAVISQCSSNTAVVYFCDYGNYEEVNLSDVKPLNGVPMPDFSVPPPGMLPFNMGVPQPTSQPMSDSQIPSMEFRRKKPDNNKPTMQFYQPPARQRNN